MRHHTRMLVAVLAGFLFVCPSAAFIPSYLVQDPPKPESRPAEAQPWYLAVIEEAVKKEQWVGLSFALVRDGRVAAVHHFGFEDREANIPASDETRYRWASISKPITAIAALQLAEQGQLDLDGDIRKLVPEFPEKPWPITCRQLLGHLGGIVHYTNGKVIALPIPTTPEHPYSDVVTALDSFKNSPLVAEPGTTSSYTTHGYMLAGAVVQRAGKASYWNQVKSRIATPAGMATFEPDYQWINIPHRAKGYKKSMDSMVRSTDTDVSWKLPGGGFISNVQDLGKFGLALMQEKLLKPESWKAMRTRQTTRDGKPVNYGLGLGLRESGKHAICAHSGAQEKTATYLAMAPDKGLAIALMCNTEGAKLEPLVKTLLERLLSGN